MVTHDLRKLFLGILFIVFLILGIAACIACMKYGAVAKQGVFIFVGIFGLADVGYAAYSYFKKYLDD